MEILEAFDLTGGLRAAAALAGCDHKTVAHYVALRDAGHGPDERPRRPMAIDRVPGQDRGVGGPLRGLIRADVVHDKLLAMGFDRLGAHHPPRGRRRRRGVAVGPSPGVSAVGARAGVVAAVRLG